MHACCDMWACKPVSLLVAAACCEATAHAHIQVPHERPLARPVYGLEADAGQSEESLTLYELTDKGFQPMWWLVALNECFETPKHSRACRTEQQMVTVSLQGHAASQSRLHDYVIACLMLTAAASRWHAANVEQVRAVLLERPTAGMCLQGCCWACTQV